MKMSKIDNCGCGCSLQTTATVIVVFDVIWNLIFGCLFALANEETFGVLTVCVIVGELFIAPIAFIGIRMEISLAMVPFLILESFRLVCLASVMVFYSMLSIATPLIYFFGFFVIDFCLFVTMCYCFGEIRERNYYREKIIIDEAVNLSSTKISRMTSRLNQELMSPVTPYESFI